MATKRIDEIVQTADGKFPMRGQVGLCRRCGGDPKVARGRAAIGTAGCVCGIHIAGGPDKEMPDDLTTEVGETREERS